MSRFLSRLPARLRIAGTTRASREREVLIRESAIVLEGVRGIRLAQSGRLPFNR